MRWNDTVTLVSSPRRWQDAGGSWHDGDPVERVVFCDPYSMGLETRTHAVDMGLRPKARVSVRTIDYEGESVARYPSDGGPLLDVLASSTGGEFVTLTLGKVIRDGE